MAEEYFSPTPYLSIPAMDAKAAVFDVDYTILQHSSTVAFAKVAIRHKLIAPHMLLGSAFLHFQVKHGMANPSALPKALPFLKGIPQQRLWELADEVFIRYMIKSIYPDALALVREYNEKGTAVFLASASLDFLLEPLAVFLEIPPQRVMTTKLKYEDGICTGEIDGRHCFGLEKLRQTRHLLEECEADLSATAFFTDSIMDYGMMRRVGYPVAANPDLRLTRKAKKHRWEIIHFR